MNIAYLILAHNQPLQLERLISRLDQPNAYFFIHIDKKSTGKVAIKSNLSHFPNLKIISNHNVNWMGFNMVESTIDLLRLASGSGIDFKYYVLMSGQDYPIKSNRFINEFFEKHTEDFISFARINDSPDNFKNKVRYLHYYDFPYTNPRNKNKIPLLVYLYFGIHRHVVRYLPKRSFYKNMEPCFGAQWFALTHETVKCILEFIKENKGYLRFMKYTEGPDETFFQTIILNSGRKTNVYDYERFEEWCKTKKEGDNFIQDYSSLRYMDWSDNGKNVPKPAILDETYFETLKTSADLFARKFDEKASALLMQQIDTELLEQKNDKS